jgi:hypothetical protein
MQGDIKIIVNCPPYEKPPLLQCHFFITEGVAL